jgi:hypothetical protein
MKSKNTNITSEVEVAACDSPARLCKSCKTQKPRVKGNPSICLAGQELIMPLQQPSSIEFDLYHNIFSPNSFD